MHKRRLAILLAVAALAGCLESADEASGAGDGEVAQGPGTGPIRFLAIGDMGTGDEAQASVAAGMLRVCQDAGCDFVIGLGDNIYEAGVTSHYDPQFALKFEQPYAAFDIPFFMSLGNHDNLGVSSGHAGGDFQVMYAARTDRDMDLWVMPDRWYEHEHGNVRFYALDTNVVFSDEGTGAQVLAPLLSRDVDGEAQATWLANAVATKQPGEWVILHGHHPLYSNGEHGDSGIESPALGAWLMEAVCASGNVDLLVTGHDHDLQWLAAKPDACGRTEFVVSGAAAQVRSIPGTPNPHHFACGDTLGFTWMEIDGERLHARMHRADGAVMFERILDRADPSKSLAVTYESNAVTCSP